MPLDATPREPARSGATARRTDRTSVSMLFRPSLAHAVDAVEGAASIPVPSKDAPSLRARHRPSFMDREEAQHRRIEFVRHRLRTSVATLVEYHNVGTGDQ
jgi:hypothetical protein